LPESSATADTAPISSGSSMTLGDRLADQIMPIR
jgi:hypothetical protein